MQKNIQMIGRPKDKRPINRKILTNHSRETCITDNQKVVKTKRVGRTVNGKWKQTPVNCLYLKIKIP